MTRRYPRFVVEGDKCIFKLFDVEAEKDIAECEITKDTAFALVLSLLSFIEAELRAR